jgi:inner membrane protein
LLDPARDLPAVAPGSRAHADTERFVRFSDGYAALHPRNPAFVGDIRYSLLPDRIEPLWGITYEGTGPTAVVRVVTERAVTPEARRRFLDMLFGR